MREFQVGDRVWVKYPHKTSIDRPPFNGTIVKRYENGQYRVREDGMNPNLLAWYCIESQMELLDDNL